MPTPRAYRHRVNRIEELQALPPGLGLEFDVRDQGSIVVVTHDITAALTVADTIWLLGRDRDEKGNAIPGARIQASYNLIERDLAYRKGISTAPEFIGLLREIKERFATL